MPHMPNKPYSGDLISELDAIVNRVLVDRGLEAVSLHDVVQMIADAPALPLPCEFESGATMSDPGGNVPCGKAGRYRPEYEMVLCDRCAKEMQ